MQIKSLDQVFPEINAKLGPWKDVFLKMDTQGFDLKVLKGAEKSLDQIRGIQSEISVLPIYDNMPDYLTSLKKFREKSFEVTGLYPVSRNRSSMVVVEFDCIMVKQ